MGGRRQVDDVPARHRAFPPACFSSFIAANSFKTTLPKVNPFISVGIGAVVSIILAVTGVAGKAIAVFGIIGASFGPICGAMMVDYLLSGGNGAARAPASTRRAGSPGRSASSSASCRISRLAVPAAPGRGVHCRRRGLFLCAKMGMHSPVVPVSGALAEATK